MQNTSFTEMTLVLRRQCQIFMIRYLSDFSVITAEAKKHYCQVSRGTVADLVCLTAESH